MTHDSKQAEVAAQPVEIEEAKLDDISGGPIYMKVGDIKGSVQATGDGSVLPASTLPGAVFHG